MALGTPLALGWDLLVPAVAATFALAAVAAAIPAVRAARRDPVAVLKEA
jgi:ABC-type antimicrobial peptide transport system permease subunit